jgi:hypothetical protein
MENNIPILLDESSWPHLKEPELIEKLEQISNKAYSRYEEDGYISSIIIKHQIVEEIIRLLITDSQYIMATHITGPYEYIIKPIRAKMFGDLLIILKRLIEFENKREIIQLSEKVNEYRINVVHKILSNNAIEELSRMASDTNAIYKKIKDLYTQAHESFTKSLKLQKSDLEGVIEIDLRNEFYRIINFENHRIRTLEYKKRYKEWVCSVEGLEYKEKIIKYWCE